MTKQTLLLMSCAAVLLTACGGGGGGSRNDEPAATLVSAEAYQNSVGVTNYLTDLTASSEASTEMLEPISLLPDPLPSDDTAEPREIP